MRESQAVDMLAALAHPVRLRIMRKLIAAGEKGLNAGDIGSAVAAAPSKVSFHIASLESAGLVTAERVSRHIYYRTQYRQMGQLMDYLLSDCCGGDERIVSCCSPAQKSACK